MCTPEVARKINPHGVSVLNSMPDDRLELIGHFKKKLVVVEDVLKVTFDTRPTRQNEQGTA